jgi:uncharacterized coiled-coil DUF342 family protein
MSQQSLIEMDDYITKKEMGYSIEPIDLETLKGWHNDLSTELDSSFEELNDQIYNLESERDELQEERDKLQDLVDESLKDAQEWKRKCRELEQKLADIELDAWRAKRRAK